MAKEQLCQVFDRGAFHSAVLGFGMQVHGVRKFVTQDPSNPAPGMIMVRKDIDVMPIGLGPNLHQSAVVWNAIRAHNLHGIRQQWTESLSVVFSFHNDEDCDMRCLLHRCVKRPVATSRHNEWGDAQTAKPCRG